MPLGIGDELLGNDIAWLFQPYLAFLAAMLALALYAVARRPDRVAAGCARVAAFVAAQPALLYGYALWGGIKELATAWLLALIAALCRGRRGARRARAPRCRSPRPCAALVACSTRRRVWLAPAAPGRRVVLVRAPAARCCAGGAFVGSLALLAIPAIVAAVDWLPRHRRLRQGRRARQPDPAR